MACVTFVHAYGWGSFSNVCRWMHGARGSLGLGRDDAKGFSGRPPFFFVYFAHGVGPLWSTGGYYPRLAARLNLNQINKKYFINI